MALALVGGKGYRSFTWTFCLAVKPFGFVNLLGFELKSSIYALSDSATFAGNRLAGRLNSKNNTGHVALGGGDSSSLTLSFENLLNSHLIHAVVGIVVSSQDHIAFPCTSIFFLIPHTLQTHIWISPERILEICSGSYTLELTCLFSLWISHNSNMSGINAPDRYVSFTSVCLKRMSGGMGVEDLGLQDEVACRQIREWSRDPCRTNSALLKSLKLGWQLSGLQENVRCCGSHAGCRLLCSGVNAQRSPPPVAWRVAATASLPSAATSYHLRSSPLSILLGCNNIL
ncbi:hypothetical protein EDD37DRAFT_488996 [Exophiala viscosa]|uniref:uncharacterized protein n=1 Tax=Exophiala viscosa TaxID=2486360 RepID=UPI002194EF4A|nr:hypothetical protein EDD37DRAFT_488996 [Exophiala viscosa]